MRARWLLLLAALPACDADPAGTRAVRGTLGFAVVGQRAGTLSTLSEARLTAEPGSVSPAVQPVTYGGGAAAFEAVVPAGQVTFTASLYSNNGVLLYRGASTATVARDGFQVELVPVAAGPIMIVFPDTVNLLDAATSRFTIGNPGTAPLAWSLAPLCDQNGCLVLSRSSGTVAPGTSDTVAVSGYSTGATRIRALPIASSVGSIELRAVAPVDTVRPTIALAGIADRASNPATRTWTLTAADAGRNASGLAADPFRARLRRVRAGTDGCFLPTDPFTGAAAPCTSGGLAVFQSAGGTVAIDGGAAREGYWEISAFALDRAGNSSAQASATALLDVTPPQFPAAGVPVSLAGNGNHALTANLADNVDLAYRSATLRYAGQRDLHVGNRTLGAFGIADGLATAVTDTVLLAGFIRGWEATDSLDRASGAVREALGLLLELADVAGNRKDSVVDLNAAVRIATDGPVPSLRDINPAVFAPPDLAHGAFTLALPALSTLCRAASGCTNPSTTTLRATINGAPTFANPFVRVEFHYYDSGSARWVLIGSAGAPTVATGITERRYTFSRTWNVSGLTGTAGTPLLGSVPVVAVGVHVSGSALISTNTQRTFTIASN